MCRESAKKGEISSGPNPLPRFTPLLPAQPGLTGCSYAEGWKETPEGVSEAWLELDEQPDVQRRV